MKQTIAILMICLGHQFSDPLDLVLDQKLAIEQNNPDPFFEDKGTTIRYRAMDVESASIVIFNSDGEKIRVFDQLEEEGKVILKPYELPAGEYRYALLVYNRMSPRKHMTVLKKKETDVTGLSPQ
jgi:hypothetical protein